MTAPQIIQAMAAQARVLGISANVIAGIVATSQVVALATAGTITHEQAAAILGAARDADAARNAAGWNGVIAAVTAIGVA